VLEYVTAGESHGAALHAVITGLPAGLRIDRGFLDGMLRLRQGGYGRSRRQRIEQDRAVFLSGVRRCITTGNPVTVRVRNRARTLSKLRPVTRPRPGHADLAGVLKFGHGADARDVLERASARETAARTAVGAVCALLLREFRIDVLGHVVRLGPVRFRKRPLDRGMRDRSSFHSLDPEADLRARQAVDEAAQAGDTLGGVIEVVAVGLPPGLGANTQSGLRLEGRLAGALLSIPAMKGVEVGLGFAAASRPGSKVHDRIRENAEKLLVRPTNRAGGIEGGMTNGEPVVVRIAMKPLSTLRRALESVDLKRGGRKDAHFERSDITAVPAGAIVCEAVVGIVLAQAFLDKFGGDSMQELRRNVDGYYRQIGRYWRSREA